MADAAGSPAARSGVTRRDAALASGIAPASAACFASGRSSRGALIDPGRDAAARPARSTPRRSS
ncbi:hypothetical protein WS68_00380 [Burkholderia sp. TSV86]|nr:hypothetical protein WS68_00380 [Burkholderia sp. TSV86]